ncbi:MAG: hypothetical protein DRI61_12855, partial [Chloroflexi bacterium]
MAAEMERALAGPQRRKFLAAIPVEMGWFLVAFSLAIVILLAKFKPDPFGRILNFLLDGVLVTLAMTVTSFFFILLIGLIGGVGRLSKNSITYGISTLYVEVIRGVPLLVQLLFIWFALPQLLDILG